MAQDTDSAILDAARVRRTRLISALERGSAPGHPRRTAPMVLASLVVAALICAGCVGYSYISTHMNSIRGGFSPTGTTATVRSTP